MNSGGRRIAYTAVTIASVAAVVLLVGCKPTVPQLIGMRQADAVRAIEEAGFTLGNVNAVATDEVAVGLVANQSPAYGSKLKKGEAIDVSINFSNGSDAVVPTVTGLEEQTAVNVAETTDFVPLVTSQYSDVVAEGLCAAQSPAPGAQAKAGDTLVIVMSKGKEPARADVPDVEGKSQGDAESAIESAGFKPETFKVYDDEVGKGKVVGQLPEAGTSAVQGSTVQIVVSLGKGTGAATVPTVTGKSESEATKAIADKGFKAKVYKQYSADVKKGTVGQQFPAGGSTAAAGSEVLLVVSLGVQPAGTVAVPNVVGKKQLDAVAAIEDAGLVAEVRVVASSSVAVDTVGAQFPAPGEQLPPGGGVLIGVSSGPATTSSSETTSP